MIYYSPNKINKSRDNAMNAISLEHKRSKLAQIGAIMQLKRTYRKGRPEIPNKNSKDLWNLLNKNSSDLEVSSVYNHKLSLASKYVKRTKGNILNIGVGTGFLERKLLTNNLHLQSRWFGMDFDTESIKRAKRLYKESVFKFMLLEKISFPKNSFSLVLALDVLEHISPRDVFTVLGKVKKILKMGGQIVISVPINEGLEKMLNHGVNPNAHVRIYTKELLEAELKIAGFEINEIILLYAFKNYYKLKYLLTTVLGLKKEPNLLMIVANKK